MGGQCEAFHGQGGQRCLDHNQRSYQAPPERVEAGETRTGMTTTTTTTATAMPSGQQPTQLQWPYIWSLESFQADQSLSLLNLNFNKSPDVGRQPVPQLWRARRPLVGVECSTFAAADVRRALRLVTSNHCSLSTSFALPPQTASSSSPSSSSSAWSSSSSSSSSHLQQNKTTGKLALEQPKGCDTASRINSSKRHRPPVRVAASNELKCTKATKTNDISRQIEHKPPATSCLYSTAGVHSNWSSSSNSNSNSNLINAKQLEGGQHQQRQEQHQQLASKSLDNISGAPSSSKTSKSAQDNQMQSLHSLSMQLDSRQASSLMQPQVACGSAIPAAGQQHPLSSSASASSLASNKLGRLVGKKASRVKELLLQNLGRADRTHDQLFDLYEENFFKQQHQAHKIAKEFKAYLAALRAFHEASRSLNSCIQQSTGDYQSARHDLVCENLSQLEQLNEELVEKLREQVMVNIGQYLAQFAELKEKISKRHRKLIDFDSSRRAFELMLSQIQKKRQQRNDPTSINSNNSNISSSASSSLGHFPRSLKFLSSQQQQQVDGGGPSGDHLSAASQLVDETRLLKLREQFNYCKIMYETINSELHDELPQMYEKKMKSLLLSLQNYFALEAHYHSNAGKLMATASDVIDELPELSAAALMRRHQKSQEQGADQEEEEEEEDDDDDDDEAVNDDDDVEDDDDDDDHHHRRHHHHIKSQQVLGQTNADAGSSSNDQLFEAQVAPSGKGVHGGGGGGSSSGVGSSRADSSSCPDTSASSSSSSPDIAAKQVAAIESGKADEPAEGPLVVSLAPPSAGQLSPPVTLAGGVCVAGDAQQVGPDQQQQQQKQQQQQQPVAISEMVVGEPTVDPMEANQQQDESSKVDETQEKVTTGEMDNRDKVEVVCGADENLDHKPESNEPSAMVVLNEPRATPASGHLYKVKTNYKYLAEDVDELCFEADEILQVVEFGESQEPEEGWLMGIREVNGQRGLFPANFTRPI